LGARRGLSPSSTRSPQLATIRAFFLTPLIRELDKGGVRMDTVLRRYGLSTAQLTSLYERVPLRHFVALAEDSSKRLERPFLGLELGGHLTLADLGPFYAMFILARNLESALWYLSRFQSAWQTNTVLELVRGNSTSAYRYCIEDPSIWPRRQDSEFAMASFTSFIRELTSMRWRPVTVEFEHDVTERITPLRAFFNAPVHGNCGANQLIIANSDLDKPLRRFDPAEHDVAPILERHLLELLAPRVDAAETIAGRVDALIARRLGRAEVTVEALAAEMSMSVRSLRRHLTAERTSFRQILQAHRRTAIEAILCSNGARLSDLASRLSYSDSAVLSRAFKSWTGMSPRAYAKLKR
jgi:AraC-like DNA-binding protein